MKGFYVSRCAVVAAVLGFHIFLGAGTLPAVTLTWSNSAANSLWSVSDANWGPGLPWTNGSDAWFDTTGAGTVTISSSVSANSLTFSASGYTINGGSLNLAGPSVTANAAATISSQITGAAGLTKLGGGALTLIGPNTYGGGTTVSAGTLQIGNGSTNGTIGSGTYSIASGATLKLSYTAASAPTWANISGGGTLELTETANQSDWGQGALGSSFTGTLQIDRGRVWTISTGNLGLGGATNVVIQNGGQLGTWNGGTFPQNFTIAGSGWGETGYESAIRFGNGGNMTTINGSVTLAANVTLGASGGSGNINGVISGASTANLTLGAASETGTVVFSNANTYSGNTSVAYGTLRLANSAALQNSTLTSGGIAFAAAVSNHSFTLGGLSGNGSISLNDGTNAVTLRVGNNHLNTTYGGVLSSSGGLTKIGNGMLTLTGNSTFTGAVTINSGIVATNVLAGPGVAQALGQGSAITLNGGTLQYTGGNNGNDTLANQFNRALTVGNNGGTIDITAGFLFYNGAISGSGQLAVINSAGNGKQLLLTGNNPGFSGNVVIGNGAANGGWIQYRSSAAYPLGSGTVTILSGGVFSSDNGATTPTTFANPIVLNGGKIGAQGVPLTVTGGIALTANSLLGSVNSGQAAQLTVAGNISGNFGLTKADVNSSTQSIVALTGTNTYTGTTVVNQASGTLLLNTAGANGSTVVAVPGNLQIGNNTTGAAVVQLGGSNQIASTASITFSGASGNWQFLKLMGNNLTVASINDAGGAVIESTETEASSGTATLTLGGNGNSAISGYVRNTGSGSGVLALTKNGSGTLSLSGGLVTYTGPTSVNGGTLSITNNQVFNSPINLAPTAALVINIASDVKLLKGISGTGPVTVINAVATGRLAGDNSGYAGTFTLPATARGIMWDAANAGSAAAAWVLDGQFALTEGLNGPVTLQLGSLQGSNTATALSPFTGSGTKTFQIGALGSNTTYAGRIGDNLWAGGATGSAAVQKVGTGMLTLSGSNTYTGDTTVSNGTLQVGSATAIPGGAGRGNLVFDAADSAAVFDLNGYDTAVGGLAQPAVSTTNLVVNNGGGTRTLTAGGNHATTTFGGTIADNNNAGGGAIALAKSGSGTLTLSGTNTYSGATSVNAGALVINAALSGTGAVSIAADATLGGSGGLAGAATLAANAVVVPGGATLAGSVGTLALGGLAATGSATYRFDLSNSLASGNDLIQVNGNLALGDSSTVLVNRTGGILASGYYPLFAYTGTLGYASSDTSLYLGPGALSLRQTSSFDYGVDTPGVVALQIIGVPHILTWVGGTADVYTNTWNPDVTSNLVWSSTGGSDFFGSGDIVTFDNTGGTNTAVALSGTLNPTTVTVSGTNNYVFGGAGKISGQARLTVQGPGALTLSNTGNDYSFGTFVEGGALVLGANNALPVAGTLTLGTTGGNGVFDLAGYSQQLASLVVGSGATAEGQVVGNSATATVSTLTLGTSTSTNFVGTIQDGIAGSGGQIAVTVAGGLATLSGSNTYSGPTTVSSGTLQLGSATALYAGAAVGNAVVNGTLNLGGHSAGVAALSGNGSIVNSGTAATLTAGNNHATSTFSGTLQGAATSLAKTGTGTLVLMGANNSAATAVNQGTLQIGNAAANGVFGTSAYNIAAGGRLYLNYATAVQSGTGTWSSLVSGAGTLELNSAQAVNATANWGPNSAAATVFGPGFTGTLQVDNGRIDGSPAGLGGLSGINIRSNGQFLAWTGTYSQSITIAGNGWGEGGQPGALRAAGAAATTWSGPITLAANAGISAQSGATLTLIGSISGNFQAEFETSNASSGTLVIAPSAAVQNSYASTQIDTGAVVIAGNPYALSTGNLLMNGGTLRLNGNDFSFAGLSGASGAIQNGSAVAMAALNVNADGSTTTYGGALSDGGAQPLNLNKVGGGTLTLAAATTFTGATTIDAGTLRLGHASALQSSTLMLSTTGGAVDLNGLSPTLGGLAGNGNLTVPSGTLSVGNNGQAATYGGSLDGAGSVVKIGAGIWTLSGSNAIATPTTISAGTLRLAHSVALAQSTVVVNANNGLGFAAGTNASTIGGLTGNFNIALQDAANAPATLGVGSNNATTTYSAALTGGGGLTKVGSGTLTLASPQAYSGATIVDAGILTFGTVGVAGFGGNGAGWTVRSNGVSPATVSGDVVTLTTTAASIANAIWNNTRVPVAGVPWTANFTYNDVTGNGADGGAFVFQTDGTNALGGSGGAKGLSGGSIVHSAEIVWNIYNSSQVDYTTAAYNVTSTTTGGGVNLRAANTPTDFSLAYDGSAHIYLTATQGANSWSTTYSTNLASALNNPAGGLAYLGFVGGTGGAAALQRISNFSFNTTTGQANYLPAISALQVNSGGTVDLAGFSQTLGALSGGGTVTNSHPTAVSTLSVGNDGGSATFSGTLTAAVPANLVLTKVGSGTQTIAGTSLYAGGTTINAGNLVLSATDAVPGTGTILINAGGALNATGAYTATEWLASTKINTASAGALALVADSGDTLDFTQNGGYSGLHLGAAGAVSFSGSIAPAGGVYRLGGAGGTLTIPTGNILTGPNDLAVGGPGTVVLASTNDFTGLTTINTGTLQLNDPQALAGSTVVLLAASNGLAFGPDVNAMLGGLVGNGSLALRDTAGNPITLSVGANGTPTAYSGILTGSGSLVKTGTGTLTLNGASTFTGSLTVNNGAVATNLLAGPGAAQGIGAGGSLVLDGGTFRAPIIGASNTAFAPTITVGVSGGTLDTQSGYLFYAGALSGSGQLTVLTSNNVDSAWLLYTGASPGFTGNIVIGDGVHTNCGIQYRSSNANPFGTVATITINGGAYLTADNGATVPSTLPNAIVLNGGTLATQSPTMTYTGPVTVNGGVASGVGHIYGGSGDVVLSGNLSGSGTVSSVGGRSVVLSGTNSGFSGVWRAFSAQTWFTTPDSGSPAATWITAGSNFILALPGGGTVSLGALAGNTGVIRNDIAATTATISVGALGADTTFGGTIADKTGDATSKTALLKTGSGSLLLTASNTYSGGTTVGNGTLQLGAVNALGTGGLTANAGAVDLNGFDLTPANSNALPSLAGTAGVLTDTTTGTATVLTVNQASDTTFGGSIQTGPQGRKITLAKYGAGSLTLAGANTAAGGASVRNAGTLKVTGTLNTTTALNSYDASSLVVAGQASANNLNINDSSTLSGAGTINLAGEYLYYNSAAASTFAGTITGGTTSGVEVMSGLLTLGGSSSYQSDTFIDNAEATLRMGTANALPFGSGKGNVSVAGSGTFDLAGFTTNVNGLSGDGTVDNSTAGSSTLVVGNADAACTFSGTIRNTAGTLALEKIGSGELLLSGTNNYTGGTTVAGGALRLTTASAIADGTSLTIGDAGAFAAPIVPAPAAPILAGGPPAGVSPVPEPGTLALLAAGAVLVVLYRRRR